MNSGSNYQQLEARGSLSSVGTSEEPRVTQPDGPGVSRPLNEAEVPHNHMKRKLDSTIDYKSEEICFKYHSIPELVNETDDLLETITTKFTEDKVWVTKK